MKHAPITHYDGSTCPICGFPQDQNGEQEGYDENGKIITYKLATCRNPKCDLVNVTYRPQVFLERANEYLQRAGKLIE